MANVVKKHSISSELAQKMVDQAVAKARQLGVAENVAVVDDGHGMDLKTLVEAMRMGTKGPLAARSDNDLGRFGLGMKTASLSQGTRLTVITKAAGKSTLVRRWDVAHIRKSGKWELLADATPIATPFISRIDRMSSGTAVIVENLDRATYLKVAVGDLKQHFGRSLDSVRRHLAMVFHRFIESGVTIRLGATALPAWDPFLKKQSTKLATERFMLLGNADAPTAALAALDIPPKVRAKFPDDLGSWVDWWDADGQAWDAVSEWADPKCPWADEPYDARAVNEALSTG